MGAKIPSTFIDDLLARTDIVGIIQNRLPIKKAGSDYMACCPFHQEKSPSFSVSEKKQFFYCFGCGANGNAIGFLMQYEQHDFVQAVEILAAEAGMRIPQTHAVSTNHQAFLNLMKWAQSIYQNHLHQSPAQQFMQRRGISATVAKTYQLGYAPTGWHCLSNAQKSTDYTPKQLLELGLLIPSKDSHKAPYDRFRSRFIFPICSERGQIIAFGGRTIDDLQKPKYLNSPETILFQKRRTLYGLYEAKKQKTTSTTLYIVEGYMDVIALASYGINNAVATLGTAVTPQHLGVLFKHTHKLIFCFDGDPAGKKAAWQACKLSLPMMHDGRDVAFMFLPDGEDPDSLLQTTGKAGWLALQDQAQSLADFFFTECAKNNHTDSIAERAAFGKTAHVILNKLPTGIYKSLMIQRLSTLINVPIQTLNQTQADSAHPEKKSPSPSVNIDISSKKHPALLKKAIQLILHFPMAGKNIKLEHYEYAHHDTPAQPLWQLLSELIHTIDLHPQCRTTGSLLAHFANHPHNTWFAHIASQTIITPEIGARDEILAALIKYNQHTLQHRINQLIQRNKEGSLSDPEKKQLQTWLNTKNIVN